MNRASVIRLRRLELLVRQAARLCAALSHEEWRAALDYETDHLFRLMDVSARAARRAARRTAALRQAERRAPRS